MGISQAGLACHYVKSPADWRQVEANWPINVSLARLCSSINFGAVNAFFI